MADQPRAADDVIGEDDMAAGVFLLTDEEMCSLCGDSPVVAHKVSEGITFAFCIDCKGDV